MNSGAKLEDYGLNPQIHNSLSSSLKMGLPDALLKGCRGSIAAVAECAAIITTRPSIGPYPGTSGEMVRDVTNPNGSNPGPNIHVTDLVKFRGVGGDAAFDRGVDMDMWKASLECLCAEMDALAPTVTLVSKGAMKAIRSWLVSSRKPSSFGRWERQLSPAHRKLIAKLANCPEVPSLTPRHFGGLVEQKRVRQLVISEYNAHLTKFY
ncbi:MAG: hypothetical protein ABIF87_05250 [Pseudomonadota bacterium]